MEVMHHIQCSAQDIGHYVFLPGDPGRVEVIASYLQDAHFVVSNREYTTYTGTLLGVPVSVVSTGIGCPSAAIAMEELTKLGAHTFIRIGTCGCMSPIPTPGDSIIATAAIRRDGTSLQYLPIEFPAVPNLEIVNALVDSAKEMGCNYHTGVVQSKDSFYGQHSPQTKPVSYELENKWEAWIRLGCLASEMESAALFTVGNYLRVRCGAAFLAVGNQERAKKGMDNPQCHDTDMAVRVGVGALRLLIAQDRAKSDCPR